MEYQQLKEIAKQNKINFVGKSKVELTIILEGQGLLGEEPKKEESKPKEKESKPKEDISKIIDSFSIATVREKLKKQIDEKEMTLGQFAKSHVWETLYKMHQEKNYILQKYNSLQYDHPNFQNLSYQEKDILSKKILEELKKYGSIANFVFVLYNSEKNLERIRNTKLYQTIITEKDTYELKGKMSLAYNLIRHQTAISNDGNTYLHKELDERIYKIDNNFNNIIIKFINKIEKEISNGNAVIDIEFNYHINSSELTIFEYFYLHDKVVNFLIAKGFDITLNTRNANLRIKI